MLAGEGLETPTYRKDLMGGTDDPDQPTRWG
jgi:hypothetical protein